MTSVRCPDCSKQVKPRGLKLHQRKCVGNAPPPVFVIGNEDTFSIVLSFLSNQTKSVLSIATGDTYPGLNLAVVEYCCEACDNDNPAILNGLCTSCHSTRDDHVQRISKSRARLLYGIRQFDGIPHQIMARAILYDLLELDAHMILTHGSKWNWLVSITKHKNAAKARQIAKDKRKKEVADFLKQKSTSFIQYEDWVGERYTIHQISDMSDRFETLTAELQSRNLSLRDDSRLCRAYVISNMRTAPRVVDTMEEMAYLFARTKYKNLCKQEIDRFEDRRTGFVEYDLYQQMLQECRDRVKARLCVKALVSGADRIPRRWEACRDRFNDVVRNGDDVYDPDQTEFIYAAPLWDM